MDRILTYTVQPDEENMLLLDFLRSKGFSRGILSSMKPYKGAIQLNGERGFGKSVLHAGNFLRIHIPETENSENILPVKMDLSILYEDEDLLVINKPADMPVHLPSAITTTPLPTERPGILRKRDKPSSTAASTAWTGIPQVLLFWRKILTAPQFSPPR